MKRIKKHLGRIKELRVINNLLTVVAVGLALYIIVAPFIPQAAWVVTEDTPLKAVFSNNQAVAEAADGKIGSNRLFIPKLGLEEVIYEGGTEKLSKGVLRRGQTSTPDKGGNTVLVGHRFMYTEKGVFYNLDKVSPGDNISMHWDNFKYDYVVTDTFVVKPDQLSVEAPTDDSILTIYTCTPLWTSKERLVVRAKLVEHAQ